MFLTYCNNYRKTKKKKVNDDIFSDASQILRPIQKLIGLKFTVKGEELLKHQKTCVIVANHQSSLDVLGKQNCGDEVRNSNLMKNICRDFW